MIKLENTQILGWEAAIRGLRNPMNSWDKSDSVYLPRWMCDEEEDLILADKCGEVAPIIKQNDHDLMMRLARAGSVDAKYRRMIVVTVDITAPLYWWKEFDTYKVGTVANSCSTMHKIHSKEFTNEDFSCEHLMSLEKNGLMTPISVYNDNDDGFSPIGILRITIDMLNLCREKFLETKDKRYWWQMIQLLPSSYNQRRTVMLNYEVLAGIYPKRKDHKLDCWHDFCDWIDQLPYSEIITLNKDQEDLKIFDDSLVKFDSQHEADTFIELIKALFDEQGWISVSQFYNVANKKTQPNQHDYGWTNINSMRTTFGLYSDGKWHVTMSPPVSLYN